MGKRRRVLRLALVGSFAVGVLSAGPLPSASACPPEQPDPNPCQPATIVPYAQEEINQAKNEAIRKAMQQYNEMLELIAETRQKVEEVLCLGGLECPP